MTAACDSNGTVAGALDASSDALPLGDATTEGGDAGPDPCADAGVPASTLACTGLYADFATKEIAPIAVAYTPATPLWSDGAQKQRWIELPPNTQIDISNPDEWTFPVGTKLFKEFRVDGQRVETRMFQKTTTNFWVYATYAWSADDSPRRRSTSAARCPSATTAAPGPSRPTTTATSATAGRQDRILGFEQVEPGIARRAGADARAARRRRDSLTPPPANVGLTIGDDGTGLDGLALGWIHVNCGVTCHNSNPSAAGSGAGMLLRLDAAQLDGSAPNAATWDILKTTINVPCVSGSVAGLPRIVPGDAPDSVLYQLIDERGSATDAADRHPVWSTCPTSRSSARGSRRWLRRTAARRRTTAVSRGATTATTAASRPAAVTTAVTTAATEITGHDSRSENRAR